MHKIAIVSESELVWEGAVEVLQSEFPDDRITSYCIGQNSDFLDFQQEFDLVIVDIGERIFDFVSSLSNNDVKIAVMTSEVESDVTELFKLDLNGYLSSSVDTKELIHAIKYINNGYYYVSPSLTNILIDEYVKIYNPKQERPQGLLTDREWQILEYLTEGYSNKKIAEKLDITPGTVKNHIISLLRKLNVSDRTNAVLIAIKNGWVDVYK